MGFDVQITRFVLEAYNGGVDFSAVATLGRQNLNITRQSYAAEAKRYGLDSSTNGVDHVFSSAPYVDALLTLLGGQTISSVDASTYEHATDLHDMNNELPAALHDRFSLLIDGGTIEHVFDFPQAIRNVGKMLKVGGHFLSINGANNFTGHGFYQFSPELFFRVFSPENGFEVESMILTEVNDDGVWYEVTDPKVAGCRVQLVNNGRTYLMMRARKISECEMFETTPQQSDYQLAAWNDEAISGNFDFMKRPWHQKFVEDHFPRKGRSFMRRVVQASRNHFKSPHLIRTRTFD